MQGWFSVWKSLNGIYHTNKQRGPFLLCPLEDAWLGFGYILCYIHVVSVLKKEVLLQPDSNILRSSVMLDYTHGPVIAWD